MERVPALHSRDAAGLATTQLLTQTRGKQDLAEAERDKETKRQRDKETDRTAPAKYFPTKWNPSGRNRTSDQLISENTADTLYNTTVNRSTN